MIAITKCCLLATFSGTDSSSSHKKWYTPAAADTAAPLPQFDFSIAYTAESLQALPPLFLSVAERRAPTARLLLEYGASPHHQDTHGCTPLHLSASVDFQSWQCAAVLIEFGGKVHLSNKYGVTPCDLSPDLAKEQIRLLSETLQQTRLANSRLHKKAADNQADFKQQRESLRLGLRFFRPRRLTTKSSGDKDTESSGSRGYSNRGLKAERRRLPSTVSGEYPSIGIESDLDSGGIFRSASISSERSRFSFNLRLGSQTPSVVLDDMDSKSESEKVRHFLRNPCVVKIVCMNKMRSEK